MGVPRATSLKAADHWSAGAPVKIDVYALSVFSGCCAMVNTRCGEK